VSGWYSTDAPVGGAVIPCTAWWCSGRSRGEATTDSDLAVAVAVVCDPFAPSRQEENIALRQVGWAVDTRIEPFALHTDDFGKPYFALPQEVEREGFEV